MYMNNSIVLRYILDNIEFRYVKSFDPQIADMGSGALKKTCISSCIDHRSAIYHRRRHATHKKKRLQFFFVQEKV